MVRCRAAGWRNNQHRIWLSYQSSAATRAGQARIVQPAEQEAAQRAAACVSTDENHSFLWRLKATATDRAVVPLGAGLGPPPVDVFPPAEHLLLSKRMANHPGRRKAVFMA